MTQTTKQKQTREQKREILDKKVNEIMNKERKEIKYSTIIISLTFIGLMWGSYFFAPEITVSPAADWFTFLHFAIIFTVIDLPLLYFNTRRRYLPASPAQKRKTHIAIITGVCLFFLAILLVYAIYNLPHTTY